MNELFKKFIKTSKEECAKKILQHHEQNGFTVVHFAYFAALQMNNCFKNSTSNNIYYQELIDADFLLPDGIALQVLRSALARTGQGPSDVSTLKRPHLPNLNGTDFIPYFLNYCKLHDKKIEIVLYGAHADTINKAKCRFNQHHLTVIDAQNGFSKRKPVPPSNEWNTLRIMLVWLGSPKQELRLRDHRDILENNTTIVFTVWWLFDFLAGDEKRAPARIRAIHGERIRRLFTNPTKNAKKFITSFMIIPILMKILLKKQS